MPYVANDYTTNKDAPLGQWVCTRSSRLGASRDVPAPATQHGPDFCGQCVSFVTRVCPTIPVNTNHWKQGVLVKDAGDDLKPGTAIATFTAEGVYFGHAAIFEKRTTNGIEIVDQWVMGTKPRAINHRIITYGGKGLANNADNFSVIE